MRGQARMSVIVAALACACGGGEATSSGGSGTGTGTEAQTSSPSSPSAVTDELPTSSEPTGGTGTATGGTSLDPTNAFTDSSQLTEGPAMTTSTSEPPPPPNMCESSGLCFEAGGCVECSVANDCADVFATCLANSECVAYSDCTSACAGEAKCIQACYLTHPDGYDPSWAVADCSFCDVCPGSCAAYGTYCGNGGGGPGKTETCDEFADCSACSACSVLKGCAVAVQNCVNDPQCQPYQACVGGCAADDAACADICQDTYPSGYITAWAQFDCAICSECPGSCSTAQAYCQAGGGGPNNECASNGDCVEISDSLPYCVNHQCVECMTNDDCFELDAPTCTNSFCA